MANGAGVPIAVVVKDYTSITGESGEGKEIAKFRHGDLRLDEFVQVFGRLVGDKVEADNIIRTTSNIQ